jgi:uncharacterized protein
MFRLALSILALAVGPLVYRAARANPRLLRVLDAAVVLFVTTLVVLELGPHLWNDSDVLVIVVAATLGLFGPTLIEHVLHRTDFHRIENWTHAATLTLAVAGVLTHAMLDGAALTDIMNRTDTGDWLSTAVILHRIPVGLLLWWLLSPTLGAATAAGALTALAVATAMGFWIGSGLLTTLPPVASVWLRALVSGSLLHVVFYRRHFHHA